MKRFFVFLLCACFAGVMSAAPGGRGQNAPQPVKLRALPDKLKGVTLEDIQRFSDFSDEEQEEYRKSLAAVAESLEHLSDRGSTNINNWPTARVVFDLACDHAPNDERHRENYLNAWNYQQAVSKLRERSFVLGEILDSQALRKCDVNCYKERTGHFLEVLGDSVDIWEVGNEVNGEWTGDIASTFEKIKESSRLVKGRGGRTALTLYYNEPCLPEGHPENGMFRWVSDHKTELLALKLNFVLVSYYEDDCGKKRDRVTPSQWVGIFEKLAAEFNDAGTKLGMGECGTEIVDRKDDYVDWYYKKVHQELAAAPALRGRYAGGYFWWYYKNDMVPREKQLWSKLDGKLAKW